MTILKKEKNIYLYSPIIMFQMYVLFTFWAMDSARRQAINCFLIALDWPVCIAAVVHRSEQAGCNQSCLSTMCPGRICHHFLHGCPGQVLWWE